MLTWVWIPIVMYTGTPSTCSVTRHGFDTLHMHVVNNLHSCKFGKCHGDPQNSLLWLTTVLAEPGENTLLLIRNATNMLTWVRIPIHLLYHKTWVWHLADTHGDERCNTVGHLGKCHRDPYNSPSWLTTVLAEPGEIHFCWYITRSLG